MGKRFLVELLDSEGSWSPVGETNSLDRAHREARQTAFLTDVRVLDRVTGRIVLYIPWLNRRRRFRGR